METTEEDWKPNRWAVDTVFKDDFDRWVWHDTLSVKGQKAGARLAVSEAVTGMMAALTVPTGGTLNVVFHTYEGQWEMRTSFLTLIEEEVGNHLDRSAMSIVDVEGIAFMESIARDLREALTMVLEALHPIRKVPTGD